MTRQVDRERLDLNTELVTVNMGPQHPSTHGVLRIVLTLDGEIVVAARPDVGYLHRGIEKICETMTLHQAIPYTDRMDYLSPMSNNIGLAMAVEKLMDFQITEKCRVMRVICCEMARFASHMLWIATDGLDVGAGTIYFYAIPAREKVLDFFERMSGARFTVSYGRIGGLARDWEPGIEKDILAWVKRAPVAVDEIDRLLTRNKIWCDRNQDVGAISAEDAIDMGLSGPSLRAAGVEWDIRKAYPYLGYDRYDFEIPVGEHGDCYDRYLVRMEEMRQSLRIIEQALKEYDPSEPLFPDGPGVAEGLPAPQGPGAHEDGGAHPPVHRGHRGPQDAEGEGDLLLHRGAQGRAGLLPRGIGHERGAPLPLPEPLLRQPPVPAHAWWRARWWPTWWPPSPPWTRCSARWTGELPAT